MNSGIYCIRNKINDKRYIGSTKNFEKRKNEHFKSLRKNEHNKKFQNAFNKYGEKNFIFEIVKEVKYEKEIIIKEENFYINFYNSKINGYNISDASFGDTITNHPNYKEICKNISIGGKKRWKNTSKKDKEIFRKNRIGNKNGMYGKKHTEETKKKISEKNKGKKRKKSLEEKNKISLSLKKAYKENKINSSKENNGFFGKKHTEETKKKISEKNKGKISSFKGKKRNYSKEIIKNISKGGNKRLGGNNGRAVKVIINDIIYLSKKEACDILNLSRKQLSYRIKSNKDKWKNYKLEDNRTNV